MYYYAGFSTWYQAGLTGKNQAWGPYAGYINEVQRAEAYDAGVRDAAISLAKEKAAAPYAKTAGTEAEFVRDDYVTGLVERGELDAKTVDRMDAAARLLGVRARMVDNVAEARANGGYSGSDILIAKDAADPVAQVFGHELAHRMQELAPEQFRVFRQAAMDHMADSAARAKIDNYRARGMTIQYEAAMDDVAADYAGQLMENGQVLDEFIDRHRTDRTLLEKLRDAFRRLVAKLTGADRRKAQTAEGKLSAALDAAAEQAGKLQPGTGSQTAEGDVKYSIKETEGGKKYVQADRQVIFGNDPASWGEQLEDYINGKIRRGGNVQLIAEDGEVLTLTAKTAGKLASPYTSRGTTLSDDTYYTKVNAGAHIDEIAQISEVKGKPRPDTDARHGDFASGGWQYRTAYFQDFDGKYYRLSIPVARGSGGNVVYNIGDIQERSFPNTTDLTANGSSAKGGALGVEKASSDATVPQSGEESKTQYSLKGATITKTYNQLLKENEALRGQQAFPAPLVQLAQEMAGSSIAPARTAMERVQLVQAQVAETFGPRARTFGWNGQVALLEAWNRQRGTQQHKRNFYDGFAEYYRAGLTGESMDQVSIRYTWMLTEPQKQTAYRAGRQDAAEFAARGRRTVNRGQALAEISV